MSQPQVKYGMMVTYDWSVHDNLASSSVLNGRAKELWRTGDLKYPAATLLGSCWCLCAGMKPLATFVVRLISCSMAYMTPDKCSSVWDGSRPRNYGGLVLWCTGRKPLGVWSSKRADTWVPLPSPIEFSFIICWFMLYYHCLLMHLCLCFRLPWLQEVNWEPSCFSSCNAHLLISYYQE